MSSRNDLPLSPAIRRVLPNGVVIITREHHATPLVALQIFVRAGSLYEGEYLGTGISHFIEHVIDDGTPRRTRQQIDALVESLGNDSNAYTWRDHTKYYITTTPEQFPEALDVLADYVRNAIFPPEEVETQRGVILHELNRDEDEPERRLHMLFYETVYRVHPARIPVGGYRQAFEKLTREDLVRYYRQTYIPDNTVVVAVGDFETEAMQQMLAQAFGDWERRPLPNYALPQEPPQVAPRRALLEHPVELATLMMGFPTVDLTHPDTYALDMISLVLGGGESSRLPRLLCEQKQVAYSVDVWSESPTGYPGVLGIEVELEPADLEAVELLIQEQLERLCMEPVSEEELQRARVLAESDYFASLQSVEEIASNLGLNELAVGNPEYSELYLRRLLAVTPDEIQHVAKRTFRPERVNVCVLRPPKRAARSPSKTPTLSPSERVEKHTFSNGLRVLIGQDDSLPLGAIHAAFQGGVHAEMALGPIEQVNGLCRLTTALLTRSTRHRSATALATLVESIGGELDGFSGHHSFGLSLGFLAREWPTALSILAELLREPNFEESEVEWVRRHMLARIRSERDDWFAPAQRLFLQTLFQRYVYRYPSIGTEASVSQLQGAWCQRFYRRFVAPNNLVIAVYGAVDADRVLSSLERLLGDWSPQPLDLPPVPSEPALKEPRYVEKTRDMVQAVLLTGFLTTSIRSPDQYPLQVLNAVLAGLGYPGGRVPNRLRQEQLVYTSYATNRFGPHTGFFTLCAVTTPENLTQVQGLIAEELERVRTERIDPEELQRAKSMCLVNHLSDAQALADRAGIAALDELYGLGYDYSRQFPPNIQQVDADAVLRVARQYMNPQRQVTAVLHPRE